MIPPLLLWLAAALVRLISAIAQPRIAQCPRGWYVNGVRPSGESECIDARDPRPDDVLGACHHGHREAAAIPARVWCAAGQIALVRDERTIACRRGPQS